MGPKNCASVPPKDFSWIDRMYMKLETMCVEVDKNPSLLLQETSKYVESQVNAVGANVKKLCTELIQDLISAPMLSSDGTEKKLECALHCKCHCMDSEKRKLIGTDIAGFEEGGDDIGNDNAFQKQDTLKKEVSKLEILNTTTESHNPKNSRVCGPELNNVHGQEETKDAEILNTAVGVFEMAETGEHNTLEEKLGLPKDNIRCRLQQGDICGKFEVNCRNTETEESKMASEENRRGIEAKVCRGEAGFAEQARKLEEDDDKEPSGINGPTATHLNSCTETCLGSQEDNRKLQDEIQLGSVASLFKGQVSDINLQYVFDRDIGLPSNVDVSYVKCKYDGSSSAKDLEAEEVNIVSGGFRPMYSYHFSELSRSTEEEEPVIVSDYDSERDVCDEEQSAHWFVGKDSRMAFQQEISSVEKSRHGEYFMNESDLDWELL